MRLTIELPTETATHELGRHLACVLGPKSAVALIGDLGAGKTHLVQAVARALGASDEEINSPTFVIIQEYTTKPPIFHFDTYRLHDADEFAELGPEEYFQEDGICFIEWADRVFDQLPLDLIRIQLTATGPTSRLVEMSAEGPQSGLRLEQLRHRLQNTPLVGKLP